MKTAIKYIKQHKKLLFLALVLATINQIFSLLDPQIFRLLIDNYANKATELPQDVFIKGVALLLLAFIGVALVSRIAKNFQDYYVNSITQRVGTKMYAKGVDHVFSLPYQTFEDRQSGEILQKLQKARLDTQNIITSGINILFLSAIGMLFVIVYSFFVHWSIALAFIAFIPAISTATIVISKKIKAAQAKIVKESAGLAGATTETLRNVELVKSLGLEDQEIKRLNKTNEQILDLELKKIVLIRKLSFIQGTLVNATRAVLMFLLLFLLFQTNITLGEFFSILFYSFFIFSPLGQLAQVVSQYQEAKASNEELDKILKIKPKKKVKGKPIEKIKQIEFKDVSFNYKTSDTPSLNKINLKIQSGKTMAFVGPSGSGKTTLIKLLVGLYDPSNGNILFNQTDSKKVNFDEIRRRIGFVAQETQLFAGTIKDNLTFVNPNATDEQCLKALKLAAADKIMGRGKRGLQTKIGEGGLKLSGGERQRLAIARALLRNPEIIIFDEATSSLDSLTENEITKTIQNLRKHNKEVVNLLVAHRLSTVRHVDKICVLEKGKIVEQGTHDQLLKKKGLYYALWRQQGNK